MAINLKDPKVQQKINNFILDHAPLIQKHINILKSKGQIPPHVEPEDLHMAGVYGLMDAMSKFKPEIAGQKHAEDPNKGFIPFAEKHISGQMMSHIANQDETKKYRTQAKNIEHNEAPKPEVSTPLNPKPPKPL